MDTENMSFIMVRIQVLPLLLISKLSFQDPETQKVSFSGVLSIAIHVTFLLVWLTIIIFCSVKIYERIISLQAIRDQNKRNVIQEKQLFLVLVLQVIFNVSTYQEPVFQTVIPLLFCGIPSIIHFTFALWETTAFFSPFSPFFTFVSSIPKFLDPLVALLFIGAYRNAVKKIFSKSSQNYCGNNVIQDSGSHQRYIRRMLTTVILHHAHQDLLNCH